MNKTNNMAQQTAVDYLIKQISEILGPLKTEAMTDLLLVDAIQKAKQMEKEQILNARLDGFKISGEGFNGEYPYEGQSDDSISNSINNEQYYNETYNK